MNGETFLTYRGHVWEVNLVAWSPDGTYIASHGICDKASFSMGAVIWNASTGVELRSLGTPSYARGDAALAWSADSKVISVAARTTEIYSQDITPFQDEGSGWRDKRLYDPKTKAYYRQPQNNTYQDPKTLRRGRHPKQQYKPLWVSGQWRFVGRGENNDINVRDADEHILFSYSGHGNTVRNVAISPNSQVVASTDDKITGQKVVHIWEGRTGRTICTYSGHQKGIRILAWSPDGRLIASASKDKTIHIWEATTGRPIGIYRGHVRWHNKINTLAWSPDGMLIASGDSSERVRVWQAI